MKSRISRDLCLEEGQGADFTPFEPHRCAFVARSRCEANPGARRGSSPPVGAPVRAPVLGHVEPELKRGRALRAHSMQRHRDLAAPDLPQRPEVLALDPRRVAAVLRDPRSSSTHAIGSITTHTRSATARSITAGSHGLSARKCCSASYSTLVPPIRATIVYQSTARYGEGRGDRSARLLQRRWSGFAGRAKMAASRLVLASLKDRASAPLGRWAAGPLGQPVARAATLTTPILETGVRVRTGIQRAGLPGRWRRWRRRRAAFPSGRVVWRRAHARNAGAGSSAVEAGGADGAGWPGLRCWMGFARHARLGPPSQPRRRACFRAVACRRQTFARCW